MNETVECIGHQYVVWRKHLDGCWTNSPTPWTVSLKSEYSPALVAAKVWTIKKLRETKTDDGAVH